MPSGVSEPEAYVPPDAEPGRAFEWPPASRAIAIERARRARLEEGGLPVDDATLERVADMVMDPGYRLPGLYYTAEEADDEVGDDVRAAVRAYLNRYPGIDGGVRLGWRDGRRTLFVGIVGDPGTHRTALARIGGGRVCVEPRRPRTVTELQAIAERIAADRQELRAAGFQVPLLWPDPDRGVVTVQLIGGSDKAAASESFARRYGDAVAVEWLGPHPLREVAQPFGSWVSEDRRIRVFFGLDHNGQERGDARVVQETDERIVIAVSRLQPVGPTTLIGGFRPHHADLELREPVGGRAVVDAGAGVVRPSLAELRRRAQAS
jgi:hypothetical protein